jgi:hypothetical protein
MKKMLMIACLISLGAPASAGHPLWDDAKISNGLFNLAVADQVRRNCSSISGRMLRGFDHANGLYKHAQSLGYSRAQVKEFIDNKDEQNVLRARVKRYFSANNATVRQKNGLCDLGRREIKKKSVIGELLNG